MESSVRTVPEDTQSDEWLNAVAETALSGGPVACAVGGRMLVIWRTEDGSISALDDSCPHEGNRLSEGFVDDEFLICPYHGYAVGADGWCDAVGSATRAHQAAVRDGQVFVRINACKGGSGEAP